MTDLKGDACTVNTIHTGKDPESELFFRKIADVCIEMQHSAAAADGMSGDEIVSYCNQRAAWKKFYPCDIRRSSVIGYRGILQIYPERIFNTFGRT